MTAALRVLAAGPLTTLQDGGRLGWLRYGVPSSGAMDRVSLAVANALVGNALDAGALEMTLAGGSFVAEGLPIRIAVAGAEMLLTIDGAAVSSARSHVLDPGAVLRIGGARRGARAYLAVAGGFAAQPIFGSVSTHLRSGIGGFAGRALKDGDLLPLAGSAPQGPDLHLPENLLPPSPPAIRVVRGPQDDYFTRAAFETLFAEEYEITARSDRMGYRLAGPSLEHAKGFNIVSDGIAEGSIQIPGEGQPIILLADRQTTGGYPKIATVISADLPILGQRRPGERLRFAPVSLDTAQEARRILTQWLDQLPNRLVSIRLGLDSERLLAANLISGVTDGS